MSESQAPYTTDVAALVAAELDALILICPDTLAFDPDDPFMGPGYDLTIDGELNGFAADDTASPSSQAIIVGWVMAECAGRGWGMVTDACPEYGMEASVLRHDWASGLFTVEHPTSLALAALRAYRAACEAEVQHG